MLPFCYGILNTTVSQRENFLQQKIGTCERILYFVNCSVKFNLEQKITISVVDTEAQIRQQIRIKAFQGKGLVNASYYEQVFPSSHTKRVYKPAERNTVISPSTLKQQKRVITLVSKIAPSHKHKVAFLNGIFSKLIEITELNQRDVGIGVILVESLVTIYSPFIS